MYMQKDYEYISVKAALIDELKGENAFWSYDNNSVSVDTVSDDNLIAYTLRYLDLPEIKKLFDIFTFNKVKNAWRRILIPEGDYLYTLNRFLAWYFFGIKRPDAYLKSEMTRHLNRLTTKK